MTRKLRRHMNALSLSAAMSLLLPLMATLSPVASEGGLDALTGHPPRTEAADTVQADTAAPLPRRRRASSRDALSLPFFSFAQALRRGNGS